MRQGSGVVHYGAKVAGNRLAVTRGTANVISRAWSARPLPRYKRGTPRRQGFRQRPSRRAIPEGCHYPLRSVGYADNHAVFYLSFAPQN